MPRVAKLTTVSMERQQQLLRVAVPEKINAKEFKLINDSVLRRIKDLTGCACLSGVIRVLFEEQFEDVIDVQLPG